MSETPSPDGARHSAEPDLSAEEIERYARHIVLPEVGGPGQKRFKRTRVLIVGAGGLGSPVALYLAAAGIGRLGLVDDDVVSLSNLQRQIIHASTELGMAKVESAQRALSRINPHVAVDTHRTRLTEDNASDLVAGYDIVVDGSDNSATRFLLPDICEAARKPLVSGAVGRFDGSVTTLLPFRDDNPRYRDLFPKPPPEGLVPSCAEAGILGALTGIIGSIQALEVMKLAAGFGEPLIGRLLLYDALSQRFETIAYKRRKS
ncbi:molybdopterin-synthase adenylyltransferase MoeB [Afifella marina]|uniref:Molybdopterin-synthase adenylyltransferase n=1 Tax=Afifella marina DSM 2698 TaxID=1120955 RepID=A0A1G5NDS7_AFIMA|nr:molybdopterin-synthase adenylyltransferase MoeB [Afifella marina]MBK1623385.1 molybdopterin-synthase adenylyltransferase MoeB [Afifella marina DSM 2698]MBK1626379.1 molybdopterin-synthase adenylyltransferase MoeB [Afifella marina]MBK5917257.1 thiamine biosynthesis protein ThiF [Afifella marina]RAI18088.1 thiamine biosynthesis protein ThiF [Afifella marina DSM 2698]SCZ35567.1 Molybdopterin or thiamine biosynthesis adenylyltransferase [Afifella marina DSM 2698]